MIEKIEEIVKCKERCVVANTSYEVTFQYPFKLTPLDFLKFAKEDFREKQYLFSWDNVPGNDSEKLLRFLRDNFDIVWAENTQIHKSDDGKTIRVFTDENSAEIKIDEEKEKATLKIGDGRTHDLTVKKENDKLNIYFKPTYRNIKPIVKPFGDIGADKSHFVYGFMEEDLKNNEVTIKFKYQNILGESGSVGFISEPEFCEFIGVERVKMPGILLNSFEMLFSRRERI